MIKQTILQAADITWQDTTPVSVSFEDFYFSTDDGLNESRYVFLKPNKLPERFLNGDLTTPFVVAETGFGTGLNFLITWQAWKQLPSPKRPLHFFSIEKYPLRLQDLSKALSNWPELDQFIQALIKQYPPLVNGLQALEFEAGQVRLNLLFGDISTDLSSTHFKADAWYLDGFAPKKNPEMWTDNFCKLIADKSQHGTTFSTFTSASIVRKSLLNAGFSVQKQEGFGKKREMLLGDYSNKNTPQLKQALWLYSEPDSKSGLVPISESEPDYDVAIIGAGLAGVSTAHTLMQQGLRVCLIEKNAAPVMGASGQTQLAMYAKLPSEANKLFNFTLQALSGSIRFYKHLQSEAKHTFWYPSGLMQLAWNPKEQIKQQRFLRNIQLPQELIRFIDAQEASDKSGLNINASALWFEEAGWLDPHVYADILLSNTSICRMFGQTVEKINFTESDQNWVLSLKENTLTPSKQSNLKAKYIVVANSNDAKALPELSHVPTKPLRGQVTSIKHSALTETKSVVCGEGYLCPAVKAWHHFGATFDLSCDIPIIKESDVQKNIQSINNWLPEWLSNTPTKNAEFHHSAGLRCTTPDYLPIVGKAPIASQMISNFAKLRVDANACTNQYGHYYPNLFVNIGHGSKGLFTTPLAAQIIRYHICGGLPPCLEEHSSMLSPARFIIKHLIQRRL